MGMFEVSIPPPYAHQIESTRRILKYGAVFDASDPGTGKTRAALDAISEYRKTPDAGRILVLAPKSIMRPAWYYDAKKFAPHLTTSLAYASNRTKAFRQDADIYITNHDAATWLAKNLDLLRAKNIKGVIIDESTAFKHATSARSKAMRQIMTGLELDIRLLMSGTPNTNDPLHIWHQILLLDNGIRLGTNFYRFRMSVCEARHNGFGLTWEPKPEADEVIAEMISDLVIRNKMEDCIDIPPNVERVVPYDLPASLREQYEELRKHALLELEGGTVNPVHAAALHSKLLQLTTGAVYHSGEEPALLDTERTELIRDLILEREQCVVAFHWRHQRDQLIAAFNDAGITYGLIDGTVGDNDRNNVVQQFNTQQLRVALVHPMSGSHGLTLTAGTTTIWPSPTSDAERFIQFNRRIYRAGQKQRTETLVVLAQNTIEVPTYERCTGRLTRQASLLQMLKDNL